MLESSLKILVPYTIPGDYLHPLGHLPIKMLPASPKNAFVPITESVHSNFKMGGSGSLPIGVDPRSKISSFCDLPVASPAPIQIIIASSLWLQSSTFSKLQSLTDYSFPVHPEIFLAIGYGSSPQ